MQYFALRSRTISQPSRLQTYIFLYSYRNASIFAGAFFLDVEDRVARMDAGIGVDKNAFGGQTLGTVAGDGVPESLKKSMVIHVSKDDKGNQVEFKPAQSCHATFDIQLR